MGLPNPPRKTKFPGANAERETLFFPVQLTTCRIVNLTRLILSLAVCVAIHIRHIRSYDCCCSDSFGVKKLLRNYCTCLLHMVYIQYQAYP